MATIIAIFIFLLVIGLSINTVRAGENYNSSKSNTATSIGIINQDVGNLLIDYGYGGEVVNQVTEALARGVTTDGLRAILGGTSARSPAVVEEILQKLEVELDRLGIREDGAQGVSQPGAGQIEKEVSAPDATGATPSAADPVDGIDIALDEIPGGTVPKAAEGTIRKILPSGPRKEISTPDAGDASRAGFKDISGLESKTEIIEIKDGDEMRYRRVLLQQGVQALRQDLRENAQDLRDNFRENVKTTIGHVDHGKTARIAVAHRKGLRMINRFRSAIARFDHILGRLESRIEKIEARGIDTSSTVPLIEEARNMQVENEAKLVELQAKYESLLESKKAVGYLKLDGVDGKKAYMKFDLVDGEKAYMKFDLVDGEKANGYLKIDGLQGEEAIGYLKLDGVDIKGAYIKIDGIDGDRAYIKLGDIKGEISQGIAEEAREIAQELKVKIENLRAKLIEIADDIKQAGKDYNSSISNSSKRIALIQSTIEKIQKRLESCNNTDACDIVDRHAKGRAEITITIKKAIESGNREDAARLLREVRGIVVGDIELLEGVENIESIAGVLELERSLLNYVDSTLVSI